MRRPELKKGEFLTPEDIQDIFAVSTKTLSNWRAKKIGPPYIKLSGHIRYPRLEFIAYLERQYHKTAS